MWGDQVEAFSTTQESDSEGLERRAAVQVARRGQVLVEPGRLTDDGTARRLRMNPMTAHRGTKEHVNYSVERPSTKSRPGGVYRTNILVFPINCQGKEKDGEETMD